VETKLVETNPTEVEPVETIIFDDVKKGPLISKTRKTRTRYRKSNF